MYNEILMFSFDSWFCSSELCLRFVRDVYEREKYLPAYLTYFGNVVSLLFIRTSRFVKNK